MLQEKVRVLLSEKFKIDRSKIEHDTHIFNDLGADSLEMLSFITELEKEFNVEVDENSMTQLFSVEEILRFLKKNNVYQ